MCLKIDKALTVEFAETEEVWAWKLVDTIETGTLRSYYFSSYTYSPGTNEAEGVEPRIYREVLEGGAIHVFLKREDAEKVLQIFGLSTLKLGTIILVRCKKEDFIAAGYWEGGMEVSLGYRKIWIDPEVYAETVEGARSCV